MSERPSLVAICGNMQDTSYTRFALQHALRAAEAAGAEPNLIDLRQWPNPLFDSETVLEGEVAAFQYLIASTDQ